ncbi:hypothetical protein NDU88_004893 [Pleurodeles waltl]|uniref:Uncharacterized protein n=1 Tax=Pleurodeles waltl TaxID=8319 RepID=A0AAV7NPW2_PLEWA|nr:hypothetical protein NDU88_004893 [Pleurodeles waltl]
MLNVSCNSNTSVLVKRNYIATRKGRRPATTGSSEWPERKPNRGPEHSNRAKTWRTKQTVKGAASIEGARHTGDLAGTGESGPVFPSQRRHAGRPRARSLPSQAGSESAATPLITASQAGNRSTATPRKTNVVALGDSASKRDATPGSAPKARPGSSPRAPFALGTALGSATRPRAAPQHSVPRSTIAAVNGRTDSRLEVTDRW